MCPCCNCKSTTIIDEYTFYCPDCDEVYRLATKVARLLEKKVA